MSISPFDPQQNSRSGCLFFRTAHECNIAPPRKEVGDLNGAFIPQSAVEALDEGILHGLTRRNVVPCDAALIGPCQDGVAGEFACR